MSLSIALESPMSSDLDLLFLRHAADMHADTPPESIHMLPREDLAAPDIAFFTIRDGGQPVAMGALKRLSGQPPVAEIKSMHVLAEHRGRGLSRLMLGVLIDHARSQGWSRLYLETGVQPSFAAARALYASAGFARCGPFQGYAEDPNSLFLTLNLDTPAESTA